MTAFLLKNCSWKLWLLCLATVMPSGPHRHQICVSALTLQGRRAAFGLTLFLPNSSSVYQWEPCILLGLDHKVTFQCWSSWVYKCPWELAMSNDCRKRSCQTDQIIWLFVSSFSCVYQVIWSIYLLSCHYIDSLLLRIINIVRAVCCLCSPANYKRQNRYLTSHALWRE